MLALDRSPKMIAATAKRNAAHVEAGTVRLAFQPHRREEAEPTAQRLATMLEDHGYAVADVLVEDLPSGRCGCVVGRWTQRVAGRVVPLRYHAVMAMNLRLSEPETEALRRKAEQEGRSMQDVARTAITQYVSDRPQRLHAAIERIKTEDRELLERLAR